MDDTETWHRQTHIFDAADNHPWAEQIYEYDEDGNQTGFIQIDDAIM